MDNEQQPPSPPEAPDKEKMEQIRRRRMEKLSGTAKSKSEEESSINQACGSSTTASAATPLVQEPPKTKINIRPAATTPSSSKNSSSSLALRSSSLDAPTIVRPTSKASSTSLKRPRAEYVEQNLRKALSRSTPAEDDTGVWEHRTLSHIFRITLDPEQHLDSSNHRLIYLPNLRQELEDELAPLTLTKDKLDSAIIEAVSSLPHGRPIFDYLLPAFTRVLKQAKALRGYANEKDAVLKEARRLCVSYCIFGAEMPELFGREPNPSRDSLTPYFLLEKTDDKFGEGYEFLGDLASRFDEDDTAKDMLMKTVAELSYRLDQMTMNDPYKPYIDALKALSKFPDIVIAISEHNLFHIKGLHGNVIENATLFGPFFSISPLQPEVTKEYFASPKTMAKQQISSSQDALRLTLRTHQTDLLEITDKFVRAHETSRKRTLDWFASIMNTNHKRRALQVDPKMVASDGFMVNVTVVLDELCTPFMDSTFSKIDKIDVDYLKRSPRVDIQDETKINADQNTSDAFYANKAEGTSNFVSELFFLGLAAHHYGTEAANLKLKSMDREIKHLISRITEFEGERIKFVNHPLALANFERQLKSYVDLLNKHMGRKLAVEGILLDKGMQAKSIQFMRYVTVWLLRVATQSDYTPDKIIKLPLTEDQPAAFKNLPEYALEDILSNFDFISRNIPDVLLSAVSDELIALCVTFLTNSSYIKNPYLKAKLVTLLFHGSWPVYHRKKGILGDALTGTKFANDHLLHALMKFYIECESTGTHTQFYDKFNIRYEIFQVIKVIWDNDIYKQRLKQESMVNVDFFLKFVNLLLNDATYVLDEALGKFPKIHELEKELGPDGPSLTAEQRTAKEEELASAEGQAQSYMQLTNETMAMMVLFTKNLSASFTMPEIVERVAAMLNYTLDQIVGVRSKHLKVSNMDKYHFAPKTLLREFVEIYLNLSNQQRFIDAVARDGRSFKPINFENAIKIVGKHSLKSNEDIMAFRGLKVRFEEAKLREDQEDEDLGEIPDDFLDPIMATLMVDPIILPISKQTVDRSTIQSHLLSDPNDPFNRTPLNIKDVIPDIELLARITVWREEMRAQAVAKRSAAAAAATTTETEAMDTTEG
ncbi:ubiquitin elongating factor core-domain-containing protein [Calycina marina]|uniref:Ubiquitin elongating factor core-domain-containing protein n=1 Tax=Calycina marina TaxID=1763456 RepID=A0A9P8CBB5_9HELO|nr:ubiquitin elongating factor core-domain-containing protein [Calycina marina]